MYAFELSDSTGKNAGGTSLEVPAYEVNYGVVPNVQLHLVLPPTAAFLLHERRDTSYGIGDTELGAKIRFVKKRRTGTSPKSASSPSSNFPAAMPTKASE